jgi:hypothetical protein
MTKNQLEIMFKYYIGKLIFLGNAQKLTSKIYW